MKSVVTAVKDEVMDQFLQPTFIGDSENAEKIAIRSFDQMINTIPIWKSNPSDFSLYILGQFDDRTGLFLSDPKKVCNGRSVLREERKNDEAEDL